MHNEPQFFIKPGILSLEKVINDYEKKADGPPCYDEATFRASIKIFLHVFLDQMWALQELEAIDYKDRENMATAAGIEIREMIKKFTGINTLKFISHETTP